MLAFSKNFSMNLTIKKNGKSICKSHTSNLLPSLFTSFDFFFLVTAVQIWPFPYSICMQVIQNSTQTQVNYESTQLELDQDCRSYPSAIWVELGSPEPTLVPNFVSFFGF